MQDRLVAFFGLAIGFSWLNAALAAAWPGIPFVFPYGPLLAALVVAAATEGRSGLKDLADRCLRWRLSARWYAAAILTPVALAVAARGLNLLLGAPAPDLGRLGPWYRPLLLVPEVLLDAPLGEETGWRGFALPLLPAGGTALASSLVLGALIALWHLPIALQAPALPPYLLGTVASAILANWVYYNARESALLVIIYHTVQNTVGGWLLFAQFGGADLVRLWWLWCGLYWLAAIVVVLIYGPTLTRPADTHGKPADATDAPEYA
jgi:membrane protease YdiL (CAAX protease family)